jgi:tetratricopeptide (TPR) repeat protein
VREGGTPKLEEAVAAYREALKERTRERAPLDWAMTQNNLGNALGNLGERESGTAKLEEAVATYREALQVRTRELVPLDWAISFGQHGIALMLLAGRRGDAAMAETALSQIKAAFETMRDGGNAFGAGYFEQRLPVARAIVTRLRESEARRRGCGRWPFGITKIARRCTATSRRSRPRWRRSPRAGGGNRKAWTDRLRLHSRTIQSCPKGLRALPAQSEPR